MEQSSSEKLKDAQLIKKYPTKWNLKFHYHVHKNSTLDPVIKN